MIEAIDAETIYDVPLLMFKEKLDNTVIKKLKLKANKTPNLDAWKEFLGNLKNPTTEVNIALVGKYNELQDAYKSIYEAFIHAGSINECKVIVHPIHSEALDKATVTDILSKMDGVLIAPGFGERGISGKLHAIKYIREKNIPFFGICLGMQCAVVEFAKNVLKIRDAASEEVNPKSSNPVIHLMPDQVGIKLMGGTMRLGAFDCKLTKGSKVAKAYGKTSISERHRHRYEFNNEYLEQINQAGLKATGLNPQSGLVEVVELESHPFFVGVQYHPELKSTVENPHPLFIAFVKAAVMAKRQK